MDRPANTQSYSNGPLMKYGINNNQVNQKKSLYNSNTLSGKQGFTTLLTSNSVGLKKSSSSTGGSFLENKNNSNNSNGNIKKT
jgi:hypothetical protein